MRCTAPIYWSKLTTTTFLTLSFSLSLSFTLYLPHSFPSLSLFLSFSVRFYLSHSFLFWFSAIHPRLVHACRLRQTQLSFKQRNTHTTPLEYSICHKRYIYGVDINRTSFLVSLKEIVDSGCKVVHGWGRVDVTIASSGEAWSFAM